MGIGAGPFKHPVLRLAISPLLRAREKIRLVWLRDSESVVAWDETTATVPPAEECFDLAFSAISANLSGATSPSEGNVVLHCDFARMSAEQQQKYLRVADYVASLQSGPLNFLIDCPSESAESTYRFFGERYGPRLLCSRFDGDTEQFLSYIRSAGYVVTSKLHVGVCSTAFGRATIAVPAHVKTSRFYRQIGLERNCFDVTRPLIAELDGLVEDRVQASISQAAATEFRTLSQRLAGLAEANP